MKKEDKNPKLESARLSLSSEVVQALKESRIKGMLNLAAGDISGDWGEEYHLPGTGEKVWIVTEADGSMTILSPFEYKRGGHE